MNSDRFLHCLDAVEALDDLTLEELVATAFALGVFDGGRS